jgi:processive 1,2-diacylglycerol beta-glucosyltransferase
VKVAICLIHIGGGHMEAAKNIQNAVKEQHPDADVRILDGIALAPGFVEPLSRWAWNLVQNKLQFIWGWMYTSSFFSSAFFDYWMYSFPWGGLRRALRAFQPDVVVATHFVCAPLTIRLRRKKQIPSRVEFVVTEFVAHPKYDFWAGVDDYFCASDVVERGLLAKGAAPERVHKTGIPIKKAFSTTLTREAARAQLELPQDARVLFFFAGTFGGTSLEQVFKGLAGSDVYPVVVCGKNEEAKARTEALLASLGMKGKVYGFVDFMNVIMCACDFMIGKGGALSCSECLALGVPIVLYGSPPGNELGNARHMDAIGAGKIADTVDDVVATVNDWLAHPEKVQAMRARGLQHGHPNAAADVARVVAARALEAAPAPPRLNPP